MKKEVLMQGNRAIAESAVLAGCKYYFGYPITPSSEIAEFYASQASKNPEITYVQAETEIAAFNMVAGVAAAGKLGMTATSGPGFSLGAEAMSYMSSAQLPSVIVDCMRPGPGDGEILASQGDYFQLTKGAGHGDYNLIVLAPYSVQELADYTVEAFKLAVKYKNPVVLVSDGSLSKLYENACLPEAIDEFDMTDWCLCGANGREKRTVCTCGYGPEQWEKHNIELQAKYKIMRENEQRWVSYETGDAETIVVAFGSMARIAEEMVKEARKRGEKLGMLRPISLWPFPSQAFKGLEDKKFFVTELNAGQMLDDVKLNVNNRDNVKFYGKLGGGLPTTEDLYEAYRNAF